MKLFGTTKNLAILLVAGLAIVICSAYAATKRLNKQPADTTPTIILASSYYTTPTKEISLYLENIVLDYKEVKGRVGISIPEGKETGWSSSITPRDGLAENKISIAAEISKDSYDPLARKRANIIVSSERNTKPVSVLNIGDSFTARSWFASQVIRSPAFKGITFLGNRTSYKPAELVLNEGKGGWTMGSFHQLDFTDYVSPFMQPVMGDQLFYGSTNFWIDATSENPSYNAYNFLKAKSLFDPVTGLLKKPKPGDLMAKGEAFIVWDGKSWIPEKRVTKNDFAFNFSKYRRAWSVEKPDIVHILLGTNGFYFTTTTEFPHEYKSFKQKYDIMISSIKKDSPNAKIIVGTPISAGKQGVDGTLTSERANNAYKLLAESLIRDYDNRQSEGVYLLDYHAVVDREQGFNTTDNKPFSDYQGNKTIPYTPDISHPSFSGFDQMGNMYLGIIQYLR